MTALPPEDEREGWQAYEQARAFESLQKKRLPWIYTGLTVLMVVMSGVAWKVRHPIMGAGFLGAAILFPVLTWLKWRFFRFRHMENLQRLEVLRAKYGDDLPWLEVERQMAAVEEIQREMEGPKNEERGT